MDPFVLIEKEYFSLPNWVQRFPDLTVGFSTKTGGMSQDHFESLNMGFHVGDDVTTVRENRHILAKKLDFSLDNWVGAEQTHEVNIKMISSLEKGIGANDYETAFRSTDGFITFQRGILLTLCYADCVPLYFLHPESKAIGIAHAGWKGTVGGIAQEMIQKFQSYGLQANQLLVAIGPSICENCYIVDDHVVNLVKSKLEDVEQLPFNQVSPHQYGLNLRECNKQILISAGVLLDNIIMTNLCTSCNKEHFYSHRRDKGNTGRMINFIGWKEANF